MLASFSLLKCIYCPTNGSHKQCTRTIAKPICFPGTLLWYKSDGGPSATESLHAFNLNKFKLVSSLALPQYHLHLPSSCELINQFFHLPRLPRQRRRDILDPIPTDHPFDPLRLGIELRTLEELLKGHLFVDQILYPLRAKPRHPPDDLVELFLRPPVLLESVQIKRINLAKDHLRNTLVMFGCRRRQREFSIRESFRVHRTSAIHCTRKPTITHNQNHARCAFLLRTHRSVRKNQAPQQFSLVLQIIHAIIPA